MRELAVQGANDTLTASDRANIKDELDQLSAESRTRDLDVAKEASVLTRNQILVQSSQAMLA